MRLTIFYDSECPLCAIEMRQLLSCDKHNRIELADIHAEDFALKHPDIDAHRAYTILHGKLDSGELLLGLDVTCKAWQLVGKHRWLALLRWPLIRPLADILYRLFAKYRNPISRLLTGQSACSRCGLDKTGCH